MTLAEKLIKEFEQLTEEKKKEVVDFVEFVKIKDQKDIENLMDAVINENREVLEELSLEEKKVIYKRMQNEINIKLNNFLDKVNERAESNQISVEVITEEVESIRSRNYGKG